MHTAPGAGWEVFARLENGEGIDTGWSRQDTMDYIRAHAYELARESVNGNGEGRSGGNDVLHGGSGYDIIFGQEGDDILYGDLGHDTLIGGSGHDTFVFDSLTKGVDTIVDFERGIDKLDLSALLVNFDPVTDHLSDFVFIRTSGTTTFISVDVDGHGDPALATRIAVLDNITNFQLSDVITHPPVAAAVMAAPAPEALAAENIIDLADHREMADLLRPDVEAQKTIDHFLADSKVQPMTDMSHMTLERSGIEMILAEALPHVNPDHHSGVV